MLKTMKDVFDTSWVATHGDQIAEIPSGQEDTGGYTIKVAVKMILGLVPIPVAVLSRMSCGTYVVDCMDSEVYETFDRLEDALILWKEATQGVAMYEMWVN
jgi:hypothetical protein